MKSGWFEPWCWFSGFQFSLATVCLNRSSDIWWDKTLRHTQSCLYWTKQQSAHQPAGVSTCVSPDGPWGHGRLLCQSSSCFTWNTSCSYSLIILAKRWKMSSWPCRAADPQTAATCWASNMLVPEPLEVRVGPNTNRKVRHCQTVADRMSSQ